MTVYENIRRLRDSRDDARRDTPGYQSYRAQLALLSGLRSYGNTVFLPRKVMDDWYVNVLSPDGSEKNILFETEKAALSWSKRMQDNAQTL